MNTLKARERRNSDWALFVPSHGDAIGLGPTVELVLGNREVNGNGHHDEAEEPQQTLFSWAEFMAGKPVKPKGRKAQATSLSLFDWALTLEQEREPEPVGAGR